MNVAGLKDMSEKESTHLHQGDVAARAVSIHHVQPLFSSATNEQSTFSTDDKPLPNITIKLEPDAANMDAESARASQSHSLFAQSYFIDHPQAISFPSALSTAKGSIEPDEDGLNQHYSVSKGRHILRTAIIAFLFILTSFVMTNIQVLIDNEALDYFYGVTTKEEWLVFEKSMKIIANNTELQEKFPSILISTQFGGSGDHGALLDPYGNKTSRALLLGDIIFRNSDWKYSNVKATADVLVVLYALMTIAFLLMLPYFDAFKTIIRRKLKKKPSSNAASALAHSNARLGQPRLLDQSTCHDQTAKDPACPVYSSNASISSNSSSRSYALTSIFLFPSRYIHGLVFLRRLLIILAFDYGFRTFLVGLTIFPQESIDCIPVLRTTLSEKLYGAFLMLLGVDAACHDFIFSGHTSLSTIFTWFWVTYSTHVLFHPRRYFIDLDSFFEDTDAKTSVNPFYFYNRTMKIAKRSKFSRFIIYCIRLAAFALVITIAICLVVCRIHYTVDVGLGFLIGSLVFWLWHALITIYYYFKFKSHILDYVDSSIQSQLKSGQSIPGLVTKFETSPGNRLMNLTEEKLRANREVRDVLVPIKKSNAAIDFVGWVDGYDLYLRDDIGFCSSKSVTAPITTTFDSSSSASNTDTESERIIYNDDSNFNNV